MTNLDRPDEPSVEPEISSDSMGSTYGLMFDCHWASESGGATASTSATPPRTSRNSENRLDASARVNACLYLGWSTRLAPGLTLRTAVMAASPEVRTTARPWAAIENETGPVEGTCSPPGRLPGGTSLLRSVIVTVVTAAPLIVLSWTSMPWP